MEKQVLISIRPKWVIPILSRFKTVEVRKRKPKLQPPFRCYIYCTSQASAFEALSLSHYLLEPGFVVGEFVCDEIVLAAWLSDDGENMVNPEIIDMACLSGRDLLSYADGSTLWGWHISGLEIYSNPIPLEAFGLTRPPQSWQYIEHEI